MDQHEAYRASAQKHCPQSVLDKLYLVQNFYQVANELRKDVFSYTKKNAFINSLRSMTWKSPEKYLLELVTG